MPDLPHGTVTFLFTDIEGSTRLWQAHPAEMAEAMARHDALLRETIEERGGGVFKTVGDAVYAAFPAAPAALDAALAAQRALLAEAWPEVGTLRVRMAPCTRGRPRPTTATTLARRSTGWPGCSPRRTGAKWCSPCQRLNWCATRSRQGRPCAIWGSCRSRISTGRSTPFNCSTPTCRWPSRRRGLLPPATTSRRHRHPSWGARQTLPR